MRRWGALEVGFIPSEPVRIHPMAPVARETAAGARRKRGFMTPEEARTHGPSLALLDHVGQQTFKPKSPATPNLFEAADTATALPGFPSPAFAAPNVLMSIDDANAEDGAPSRQDLLQRAAALGPSRLTYATLTLTDPVLGEKMQPWVAERRARFRRLVKIALGACIAFCMVATVATALPSSVPAMSVHGAKDAPSRGVVPVEKPDQPLRTKVVSHITATARASSSVKPKRH